MKIGIDCRMWNETGIGRYIRNIVRQLMLCDQKNEYVLFVMNKADLDTVLPTNFRYVETSIRWHTFKEQFVFPIYLYREKLDILFIPNLNVPVLYFKRFVVTIHDLTVLKVKTGRASTLPTFLYKIKRLGVRIALWFAVKRSLKIFTVTEFVKKEITEYYTISDDKILITYCAAEKRFVPSRDIDGNVLKKYGIKKPYIFYIGNAHPHKNLERLVDAFERVLEEYPNLKLVLGGKKTFFYARLEKEISNRDYSKSIVFTDFIDDSDLPVLYSESEAFVNPSMYEGFGIQTLEAFSCGTKVVCSNTTSLPEVGGNIAFYFNPKDVKNIAESISTCLKDVASDRKMAGFNRVKDFSWEKSAEIVSNILTSFKK